MNRGELLRSLAAAGTAAASLPLKASAARPPDHVITVEEASWEVRPGLTVRTKTYGGAVPAKILRLHEGSQVAVEVRNRTALAQSISWHGMVVPDWVDGLATPDVPPGGTRTYSFTATPAGTRLYHSVNGGGMFSGMFGPLIIEPKSEPGAYDRDIILVLHEFQHSIPAQGVMADDRLPGSPTLSAPAMAMMGAGGMMGGGGGMMGGGGMQNMLMHDAEYTVYSINGKALGAGDPIRVKRGERVRFRIINASATLTHRLALPGHRFLITHLDGNPVPRPRMLDAVEVGCGERVDAIVTMDAPGVWVLGSTVRKARTLGLGVVIAYDGARGEAIWRDDSRDRFTYEAFGNPGKAERVDGSFDLVLRKSPVAPDAWSIDGALYPDTPRLEVRKGGTYLIRFSNMSMMEHPMHILGNGFELARVDEISTSGIHKDVVVVRPMMGRSELLFRADNPNGGRFLLMCHNWQHMEGGLASVLAYT
ncbi:multicopper oxidase family protein [bacterium]|nr:MAG: multicopper oxidase family protein [bacterium]